MNLEWKWGLANDSLSLFSQSQPTELDMYGAIYSLENPVCPHDFFLFFFAGFPDFPGSAPPFQ